MDLKIYKNKYGYNCVDCPFCGIMCYVRDGMAKGRDPLLDYKRHLINRAKAEALEGALGDVEVGSHLRFMIDHAKQAPKVITVRNYIFDAELKAVKGKDEKQE